MQNNILRSNYHLYMNYILLSLFFGAGVFAQAYILLKDRFDFRKILGIALLSLVALASRSEGSEGYDLSYHLFLYFLTFTVFFAIGFRKTILPVVNEKILLSLTFIFWYTIFAYQSIVLSHIVSFYIFFLTSIIGAVIICFFIKKFSLMLNLFLYILLLIILIIMFFIYPFPLFLLQMFLLLIPTIGTIIICFSNIKLSFSWKLFFYFWFLIMTASLFFFQFSFEILAIFFNPNSIIINQFSFVEIFMGGMVFCHLTIYLWTIFDLLPFPRKNTTNKQRMKQIKDLCKILVEKFSDRQTQISYILFIIVFQGGSFVLNYYYNFISHYFLISFWLLFSLQFPAASLMKKFSR